MRKTFFCLLMLTAINDAAGQGVPGSRDHPLVSRYPGTEIMYYEEQPFKTYRIATGPVTGYKKISSWHTTSGKLTRIYYLLRGRQSLEQVYQNYLSAFRREGFTIQALGFYPDNNVGKDPGGRTFLGVFYGENKFPVGKGINLLNGSASSGGSFYLAAKAPKKAGETYAILGGTQFKADEIDFLLDIIEGTAMETDLVQVDAGGMMQQINKTGKVDLYGIYFDFDKAIVKPESEPTLIEIATLLRKNPDLRLLVAGHTDGVGAASYNQELSSRRAKAIVRELTGRYGIAPSRLKAEGRGATEPVARNDNEEGRQRNRRVELRKL